MLCAWAYVFDGELCVLIIYLYALLQQIRT
jgi:hypothetical protein